MLSEAQIINVIKSYRKNTIGPDNKEVTTERAEALNRYHGRVYGNEEEGFSQVVTKDLSETAGWIIPAIMDVFVQSSDIVEFRPVGEEDIEQAEQETKYTNHVIMKDNPGFMIIYDAIWDALILKNGYIKHWFEEEDKVKERELNDISPEQLTIIINGYIQKGREVEVISRETDEDDPTVSVKLKIKWTEKRERIAATPPEELRIDAACRGSIKESNFVEHIPVMYRYQLIEMGMDKKWVSKLPAKGSPTNTTEAQSRSSTSEEDDYKSLLIDRAMDIVDYTETYLRIDANEDGIAELRKVVTVNDEIPPGDEWNIDVDQIPFAGGTGKRIPHRHLGEGLNDDLEDLAQIHTTLVRQALDNIYHTNHITYIANKRIDEESFSQSFPGALKMVNDNEPVTGAAMAVEVPQILDKILPAIDYVESRKSSRTGIDKSTTGLDPDILRETTKGAFLENLNRASQKVRMITRMLAETLIKELSLGVHRDIIEHQDINRTIELTGKYVPINPTEWEERTDLTVKVGLGTGSGEEKLQKLTLLRGIQKELKESGLVSPDDEHSLFVDIAMAIQAESADKYVTNPANEEFQQNKQYLMGLALQNQQQGNPLAEAEQVKGEYKLKYEQMALAAKAEMEMFKEQSKLEAAAMKEQYKAQMDAMKQEMTHVHKMHELASKEAIAAMQEEVKLMIEGIKADLGQPGISAGVQKTYDPATGNFL